MADHSITRTPEELAELKACWVRDPWDNLESTLGFEEHMEELLEFSMKHQDKMAAAWRALRIKEIRNASAYPFIGGSLEAGGIMQHKFFEPQTGMTFHDVCYVEAMKAMIPKFFEITNDVEEIFKMTSVCAYGMADAMVAKKAEKTAS